MADLTMLDCNLDAKSCTARIIIETPKGRRSKFAYDPDSGLFELKGLLPQGMVFPFDFGFVPGTLGDDGDPLDVMVFMDEPTHVGCVVQVRLIGVISAEQTEDGKTTRNDRLLAVAVHSYEHEGIASLTEIPQGMLSQVEAFFISYNKQRGKKFKVTSRSGPKKAIKKLKAGIAALQQKTD